MKTSLNKKFKALSQERQKFIQDRAHTLIRQQLVAQIHESLTPSLIGTRLFFGVTKIQPNAHQWLSVYANDQACLDRLNRELRHSISG